MAVFPAQRRRQECKWLLKVVAVIKAWQDVSPVLWMVQGIAQIANFELYGGILYQMTKTTEKKI